MNSKLTGAGCGGAAADDVKKNSLAFEHRHENKSVPGSQLLSDVQTFLAALQPYKSPCPPLE